MAGSRGAAIGSLVALAMSAACGGGAAGGDAGGASAGGASTGSAGTGGSAFCTDFTACDGPVVGTWKVDARCTPPAKLGQPSGCTGEEFDVSKLVPESTWTFRADLSATFAISVSGTASVQAPESCLDSGGAPIACADAGAYYAGRISFAGGKATPGTCQSAGGICSCTIPFVAAPLQGDGTYATAGTTLTLTLGTMTSTMDTCATATTLKMRQRDAPNAVATYAKQ